MVKADTNIKIKRELDESRKREALLASLLENSSQPFGVGYPDGRLGLVNKAFEELTGYSREELKSTDWSKILTPHKFKDMENEKLVELQHTGQPVRYEKEYIRKDGTRVPIELLVHMVKNDNGTPEYYYSFITDISERKVSEKLKQELLEKEQQLTEELTVSNEELQSTSEELQVTNEELRYQGNELLIINQRINEVLGSIQDAFYMLDHDWNFIYINKKAANFVNKEPKVLIGKNFWKIFPQYVGTVFEKNYMEAMKNKETIKFETYGKYTHAWYMLTINPTIEGITVLSTDITELKKAEYKMEKLSKHLQLALGAANMGWWHYNPITDISTYDNRYKEIFGVLGSESPNDEILKLIHPNDLPDVWAKVEEALDPVNPRKYYAEYRIYRNNEIHWIEAYGITTFEGHGNSKHAVSLVGTVNDITERKRSEKYQQELLENEQQLTEELQTSNEELQAVTEELQVSNEELQNQGEGLIHVNQALLESEKRMNRSQEIAHLGSWELDIDKNCLSWSDEVYRIFGLQPQEFDATYEAFLDNVHPDDREAVNAAYVGSIREGHDNYEIEHRVVRRSTGEVRVVYEKCEHFRDNSGRIVRSIGMVHDITERKHAEKVIQEGMMEVERSNTELEQFAYITSHDLREPLRMITSFLQLLERRYKDQLDDDANEFIGFAVDGAKRLDTMINDILIYSRVANKERTLTNINLNKTLEEVYFNLKTSIEETNTEITHDQLPTLVLDGQLMIQLFQNLIGNAIKYRSEKTPKIYISVEKEDKNWLFSVKDNGIGISQEHLERIFTIFQRLHSKEEYEGTGIGLAIVQKIVHQQGGQIWVESEPGKGSTFQFTIPINEQS